MMLPENVRGFPLEVSSAHQPLNLLLINFSPVESKNVICEAP